jgi:hypothetical protein
VLILRKGGKFAGRQIKNCRKSAVLWVCFALGAVVISLYFDALYVGGTVALFALALFKVSHRRWRNWTVGKYGEETVSAALKSLPNDFVLLNDLMLPDGRGNVDHLVIGPNGLFVIETKNYSGYVKCWADDWYVNGRKISSLSKQAKAVRSRSEARLRIFSLSIAPDSRTFTHCSALLTPGASSN